MGTAPETFQYNVAASVTNSVSNGVEFLGNLFSSEGRSEDFRRSVNVLQGAANTLVAFETNKNQGTLWNDFCKPILTDPRTYESVVAGWGLGFATESILSVATKLPKVKIGFSYNEKALGVTLGESALAKKTSYFTDSNLLSGEQMAATQGEGITYFHYTNKAGYNAIKSGKEFAFKVIGKSKNGRAIWFTTDSPEFL